MKKEKITITREQLCDAFDKSFKKHKTGATQLDKALHDYIACILAEATEILFGKETGEELIKRLTKEIEEEKNPIKKILKETLLEQAKEMVANSKKKTTKKGTK